MGSAERKEVGEKLIQEKEEFIEWTRVGLNVRVYERGRGREKGKKDDYMNGRT